MSWSRRSLLFCALGVAPALAACGFEPLYQSGSAAGRLERQVDVVRISGRDGFFLRERLLRRFGIPGPEARYVLSVNVETTQEGLAITRTAEATRYIVNGTAQFSLRDRQDERISAEGTVRSTAGYSATASPFAADVAEDDARKRLAEDLAEKVANRIFLAAEQFAQ